MEDKRGVYQQILSKWRTNQEMIHQQEVHAFEIDIIYCMLPWCMPLCKYYTQQFLLMHLLYTGTAAGEGESQGG